MKKCFVCQIKEAKEEWKHKNGTKIPVCEICKPMAIQSWSKWLIFESQDISSGTISKITS